MHTGIMRLGLAGLLSIGALAARAGTYYLVPANPAAANPYASWATAGTDVYDVVRAAMTNAGESRLVLVSNGTYALRASVRITNALTLRGVNGREAVILDGGHSFNVQLAYTNSLLDSLTISNGYTAGSGGGVNINPGGSLTHCLVTDCFVDESAGGRGGGIMIQSATGTVANCIIRRNVSQGRSGGGGICVFNNGDAVIEHCLIEHNRLMTNCHGGGISVENSLVTVRNCLIRHNRTTNNYHGAGISLDDASATKVKIVNCTIVSNVCGGVGGGVVFFGTTAKSNVIVNSILYGNHKLDSATPDNVYDINKPAVSNALAYCCLTAKSGLGYNEQGNTIEDPAFVAFEGGDYRLQRGSPCVNTGSNQWDWMAGATDLGGRPRVLDGAVDMGAFEWSPGGTLLTIR